MQEGMEGRASKRAHRVRQTWEDFIVAGQIEPYVVSDMISSSWIRCKEAGLNPFGYYPVHSIDNKNLNNTQKWLLNLAEPFLMNLFELVQGSNFMVVLADETGTIIEKYADPVVMQQLKYLQVKRGIKWNENAVGTNGIALSLIEKKHV